jgi:ABC-type bacteriocin/lantibiotic exporter with double-glycine peptidase domain
MSSGGKIVMELLAEFFEEEKIRTASIVALSLIVNVFHASGVSSVNAYIIDSIQNNHQANTYKYFKFFIVLSFAFLVMYMLYKHLQNQILTKLKQWIRDKLTTSVMRNNNEDMTNANYPKLNIPIRRIAAIAHIITMDIFSGILPQISFILIIGIYLVYLSTEIGFLYALTNIVVAALVYYNWGTMMGLNEKYEYAEFENDADLLEILNNIDRIIYRGQTIPESNSFRKKVYDVGDSALSFYGYADSYGGAVSVIIGGSVVGMVYRAIKLFYSGDLTAVSFITIMTMLILYRDKITSLVQMIPNFIEFTGRIYMMENLFSGMDLSNKPPALKGKEVGLSFSHIQFRNVSFKYKTSDTAALESVNLDIHSTGGKLIGITGISGRGKSTLIRLLLKLHYPDSGEILIDGEPIQDIDADYIRHNITYVNQTGKLFDRKVLENIMYACNDTGKCEDNFKRILQYPRIKQLFNGLDLDKKSGSLGEGLSGGQRQIVNIIGGMINDSKILVLDEPTNALDSDLKKDVINMIHDFGKDKNAVIIITHDKELTPMFNQVIHLH